MNNDLSILIIETLEKGKELTFKMVNDSVVITLRKRDIEGNTVRKVEHAINRDNDFQFIEEELNRSIKRLNKMLL